MFFLLNVLLTVVFWNMCNIAAQEGRVGWAWAYLFCSAMNGAAAVATIF